LVKQGVKILWREISGPKGISVMARNAVALQWRTSLDEIQNELPPTALSHRPRARGFSAFDWVSRDIPLAPDTGGRSIDTRALDSTPTTGAFALFKGACSRGIYDNMKTAVETIFVGKDRRYNRRFRRCAATTWSTPLPARQPRAGRRA